MLTIPQDHLALWSPEELAEALGVKEQTLADWRNARICWDRRNSLRHDLRPTLHENELFKNRANIHVPCPIDCGVTLHDALTADQIKDEATLQFSDEAVEHCITRLAEHLMRHRRSQVSQLL